MLKETIENLIKRNQMDYYFSLYNSIKSYSHNSITRLIEKYFFSGGKMGCLNYLDINKLDDKRVFHSFSVFTIGRYLMEIEYNNVPISEIIITYLKDTINIDDDRINFYWFIVALYHDYGYILEEEYKQLQQYPSINELRKKYKINKDIYMDYYAYNDKYILFNYTYISNLFNKKDTVDSYYKYCLEVKKFVNHGIIGGEMLFDGLVKSYEKNYKKLLNESIRQGKEYPDFSSFNDDKQGLKWEKNLLDVYRVLADTIINHNIWSIPKEQDSKSYVDYGLEQLRFFRRKIGIEEPLLFILCLVDSIDPIKLYRDLDLPGNIDKILSEVDFIIEKKSFIISGPQIYLKQVEKNISWLNVKVNPLDVNSIEVVIL